MDLDDNEEEKNSKKEPILNTSPSLLSKPVFISSTSASTPSESTSIILPSSISPPLSPVLAGSVSISSNPVSPSSSMKSISLKYSTVSLSPKSSLTPSKSALPNHENRSIDTSGMLPIETSERELSQEHKSSKPDLSISQHENNDEIFHKEFLLSNQIENSSIISCKQKNNLNPEFESLCKENGNHCILPLDDCKKSRSGSLVSSLFSSSEKNSYLKCYQLQCFALLWFGYCSAYFLRKPLGVVKTVIGDELELGMMELGCLDICLMLPYAGLQIVAPGLTDTFGPRKVISVCLTCASIATFTTSFAGGFPLLAGSIAFTGFFLAPVWPASARMLSSWFPDSKLNSVFGMISTATYTGGMGGTALAAIVLEYSGWRLVFVYASSFAFCIGLLLLTLRTPQDRKVEVPGKQYTDVTEKKVDSSDGGGKRSFCSLLGTVAVKELCLTIFCVKFVRHLMYLWLPLYLVKTLSYTKLEAGLLSTMYDLGGIFGSPFLGITLDCFIPGAPLKGIALCLFIGTLSVGAFMLTATWGLVLNCICLLIMGATNCGPDSMLAGSVAIDIGNRKADGNGASVTSLVNGVGALGGAVEGPIVWLVWQLTGWTGVLGLVLTLTAFGALSCTWTFISLKKSDTLEETAEPSLEEC